MLADKGAKSLHTLSDFPSLEWQNFGSQRVVRALTDILCELEFLKDWPSPETWQTWAQKRNIWDGIGHVLAFTLEEKPGQRARRRLKDRKLGRSYEASICEQREIPTRAKNLHDFFNSLVWMNFPLAKYALHRRAYEIQTEWWSHHGRATRCPLADRLTCFDEGGLVFDIPPDHCRSDVECLLLGRDDAAKESFAKRFAGRFTLFGHGMMEVMMKGNHAIHSACILLESGAESQDLRLARYLRNFGLSSPNHGSINVAWLIDNEFSAEVST